MLRFGEFELDLRAYQLRRGGRAVKMERIPMDLLCLLVRHAGQLLSRETIIENLWGKEIFLDTDNGINVAVRKIRHALRDDPRKPRFVQTVAGKGYRFAVPVVETAASSPSAVGHAAGRIVLAVLPFENLSNDVEQEYFSDGLTEETITHLGQLNPHDMGVIARTSSMAYKKTTKTIADIGRELMADYILEGSVRRDQGKARITAQLIRVADQTHLWAESYDRRLENILEVQNELGVAIAQKVQLRLGRKPALKVASRTEPSVETHDAYLRGRYHWAMRTLPEIQKAIGCFQKAVQLDPTYAPAYAGLADCHIILPITSDARSSDCFPRASEAVAEALKLDESLAEAHTSLGTIRFWYDWDFAGAERCYRRALEINANYVVARLYRAHCLSNTGAHHEALAEIRRACRLDPLSPILSTLLAEFLYHDRKYDQATIECRNAIELAPNFWIARLTLAKIYEQTRQPRLAIAELEMARRFSEGNTEPVSLLGYVMATTGKTSQAEGLFSELCTLSKQRYVPPVNLALLCAGLGDTKQTLDWLEQGYEDRDVRMTFLLDPKWDRFRQNGRFRKLLRQVGLDRIPAREAHL
ncbi:MAG: winged helix-turn-helix domain-containing protein [Candidatus Sulfotelmatobacter sp.]